MDGWLFDRWPAEKGYTEGMFDSEVIRTFYPLKNLTLECHDMKFLWLCHDFTKI